VYYYYASIYKDVMFRGPSDLSLMRALQFAVLAAIRGFASDKSTDTKPAEHLGVTVVTTRFVR
jgi:hypothetical protein